VSSYLEKAFGLTGRRAVVTGAGRGIGRAMAEALAGAGAEVLVHYHTSEKQAEEVVNAITSAGGEAWKATADLTKPDEARSLFKQVAARWGGLDILINNAGDLIKRTMVADADDELIDSVFRLNVNSMVYCTREAIPLLKKGTNPSIINIGSIAAFNGGANGATLYAATKGSVHTFTYGLAKELAPDIRVNAIAPGVIKTDFHSRHTSDEGLKAVAANTPMKRLGVADDHGAAAVFLACDGAGYVTGHVLDINGAFWVR